MQDNCVWFDLVMRSDVLGLDHQRSLSSVTCHEVSCTSLHTPSPSVLSQYRTAYQYIYCLNVFLILDFVQLLSGVWTMMISDCPVEPPVCWRQESQVPSVEEESSRPEVLTPRSPASCLLSCLSSLQSQLQYFSFSSNQSK